MDSTFEVVLHSWLIVEVLLVICTSRVSWLVVDVVTYVLMAPLARFLADAGWFRGQVQFV